SDLYRQSYRTFSHMIFFFFLFSSRRRHTRSKRDWSSDVCSSDLLTITSVRLFYPSVCLPDVIVRCYQYTRFALFLQWGRPRQKNPSGFGPVALDNRSDVS